jgi:CDP-diacylglycerol--glycerol-3-phosphate 3-phosphatidyltransferase
VVAVVLIVIAWITDLLDGYLARRLNAISEFGKIIDPVADKTLILVIVLSLVASNNLSLSTAIIIVARDIVILTAGLVALKKFKFAIPSNIIGKISAFLIGCCLFVILIFPNPIIKHYLEIVIILVAILSILLYSSYYFQWIKKLRSS